MRKLTLLILWGATLALTVAPLAAQNTVDVLGGPQPTNTTGCPVNTNCIPATWSTTSNAGSDITAAIAKNFVFVPNGGALATDFPAGTSGRICLADTRDLGAVPTLFGQIAANCQAKGGVALLLVRDSAVTAPSGIPVFTISTGNGDFLRTTSGFDATTGISTYQIRINVAVPAVAANPTGQHNCPNGQAVTAYVGPGTATYTPNESLCLPSGAGQAVEPSMTVDAQGTIYVESIRGVPGGLDLWRWNQAGDGGPNADGTLPFRYQGQPDCGMFITPFCQASGLAPGGGDGDVAVNAVDPSSNTPNLAVVSLTAAEITSSNSSNRADTFSTPDVAAAGVPFDDRMWIDALDDPNHVYMEYHDFGTTSQIFVQRSDDGGQTYSGSLGTVVDVATESSVGPPTGNIAGQIRVDRSRCSSHGNLYQVFVGPDNALDNLQNKASFMNAAYVGVASGVSPTSLTLSFTDYKIFSCGAGTTCPSGAGLGNLFPALAVDNFGYVYAVWSDNSDVYYAYSKAHGTRWSPAIKVTQNTPQAGKSNLFPWVAADGNGHVAIAWYGADQSGNSNTVPLTTNWNVYVAESVNAHAFTPVFTFSQATDHANHTGQISTGGLLGSSDRSLADFFQIAMDPSHRVNIAFADNHAGTSVTYFTRQRQATSGIVTTGACAGSCREADGEGDEGGANGGNAHFRFHHDNCNQQPDSEDFSDSGAGIDFHSTQVSSATFDDLAHSVTIAGVGTNNGLPVAFTMVAVDSTLVSPGLFSITLSNGYQHTGNLLAGSVAIY